VPFPPSTIIVIDDDPSVRRALGRVMTSDGLAWEAYGSSEDFLNAGNLEQAGCVVADMTLPGMDGIELKERLNTTRPDLPLIFLTAHDTTEIRIAARAAGAAGFFSKPVDTQALLDAIHWALHPPPERPPP
jgi:FixJ family two-component response regulator